LPRRILFAIRSKLGDTLISFQCARAYADMYPQHQVTLLTRTAYARLFAAEAGIRVIGFNSRIGMAARLLWLRIAEPAFDVLAVLWGSGPPIRLIGRLVDARRKIAWSGRFAPEIFEAPALPADPLLIEPAALTIRVFETGFRAPQRLNIPSLAARYQAAAGKIAVGVVPIADEARRNLDPAALGQMLAEARRRHPAAPIRVFVNPGNAGADALIAMTLPAGCEVRTFNDLTALVDEYMQLAAWIGTDTGLFHLAVAIGVPATVFFGPTQPHKIVMPAQANARVWRLAVLGDSHCDEKSCQRPLCLHAAIACWAGTQSATRIEETPAGCPLRGAPGDELSRLGDASPT
jgi:ADP-heptose:LPS heptosyltransferase